jgi:hypothetical protein
VKVGFKQASVRNTLLVFGILLSVFAAQQMLQPVFASGVAPAGRAPAANVRPLKNNGNAAGGTRATTRATDERFGGSEGATAARNEPGSSANTSLPGPDQLLLLKPRARKSREACRNQRRAVDRFDPRQAPIDEACPDFPGR